MRVSELDRDWLDTPFLMQGFIIEDPEDIHVVAQYCEHVWIDSTYEVKSSATSSNVGTATSAPTIIPFEYEVPVEQEHKRIHESVKKTRAQTRDLMADIRLGLAVDTDTAKSTVGECVSSVLRNPDALVWMSKIREESEYTAEHSLNVCILAVAFGRQLGMEQSDLEKLGLCALLHDIGKMRVPVDIIDKPGALSSKEMNMMKAHTVHGRNLLLSTPSVFDGVIDVAYSHHERIDGTGYPRKLSGPAISKFARIVAIVDAYDAMTADRCYSQAKSTTEALRIIYQERGKQFDSELALQFIKTIGLFPVGSVVELYNGGIGIVIETNQKLRHLPRVVLVLNADHSERDKHQMVDLSHIECGDLARDYLIKQVLPDGTHGVSIRKYQEKGVMLAL